ncbi:hypothetical protein M0812_22740 [Anaeramoeba flamelloides]|uniref:Uncharacterized protein n=1 Tax=Anaeramoeba flamelloides TaxID=1746091 RepID=A0AAV7Z149_9EUKA|nr:hypothetical protein M0812_22740 [Anaeramoeba flamelloides]
MSSTSSSTTSSESSSEELSKPLFFQKNNDVEEYNGKKKKKKKNKKKNLNNNGFYELNNGKDIVTKICENLNENITIFFQMIMGYGDMITDLIFFIFLTKSSLVEGYFKTLSFIFLLLPFAIFFFSTMKSLIFGMFDKEYDDDYFFNNGYKLLSSKNIANSGALFFFTHLIWSLLWFVIVLVSGVFYSILSHLKIYSVPLGKKLYHLFFNKDLDVVYANDTKYLVFVAFTIEIFFEVNHFFDYQKILIYYFPYLFFSLS